MIEITLEIEYLYYGYDRPATAWMYRSIKGEDITECKEKAEKAYNTYITGLGWKRITKLVAIRLQRHGNEPPIKRITDSDELSAPRKSSKRAVERPKVAATGKATKRAVSGTTDSKKPKADRSTTGSTKRKKPAAKTTRAKKTKRS